MYEPEPNDQDDPAAATRGRARVLGAVLAVLGLFLTVGLGILLRVMSPMLLHPGVQYGSSRFSGDRGTGLAILALLSAVFAFGVVAFGLGLWRLATARFGNLLVALSAVLAGTVLVFGAMFLSFGR